MTSTALLAVASLVLAQATGPIVLMPRQAPATGEIGAYYFDTPNESQVWVSLEPASEEAGPKPVFLNVTVKFPGTRLNGPPETVQLRAQVRCFPVVFPERVRTPVLVLSIDGRKTDLSPDGQRSHFLPTCTGVPRDGRFTLDTVVAQVPFDLVRRLASAKDVRIDAIGFSLRFTPEDYAALQSFVRAIDSGVVLKK
ncbi:MAG TPA: hypothetical protein VEU08_07045 [Vicinamibacterales bacterium]|nr:hypothetical protein [Vicinamibacterales bacterium]